MAKKEILVGYGVDIDAVAGWLGSYGGEDSPDDISRGLFAGEVGIPRLLKLFKKNNIKVTWFAPGHSIETFPEQMKMIVADGHEIGAHGYSHENPLAMTPEQEEDILVKSIELITELTGKPPTGYVAPWWEFSNVTDKLLKNRGEETDLVEIPANWDLDDIPPLMFMKKSPNSFGFYNPHDIFDMWADSFSYVHENYDFAVFPMTIHPDVSGRIKCLGCHQKLIDHINKFEGVRWCTLNEMADEFIKRFPKNK